MLAKQVKQNFIDKNKPIEIVGKQQNEVSGEAKKFLCACMNKNLSWEQIKNGQYKFVNNFDS